MAKDKKKEPEQTPETQEQKAEASQPEEAEKKECPLEETELQKLQKEFEEHKQQHLRVLAEYDNFRKRSAREKDAAFGDGVAFAVEKLLGVLDTLSLAANTPTQDENYKKGVMMTLEQCAKAFEAIGVEEIEAEGKPFDPQLCAAVMQQAAPEGTESGTVTQVLQKGYTYKGKVVRHASVAVAE